jgi:hypothetical protein
VAYPDFVSFVREVVLSARAAAPNDIRLDGQRTGGNRDSVGKFAHQGKLWTVHADSHYAPLDIAYQAALSGRDPFIEQATQNGTCLVLVDELRAMQKTTPKHLYIYETN